MYAKDIENKVTLQISNDAFYYLKYGEEPLDEDNLEEAVEIQDMFPLGYEIEDNWEIVEGVNDTIQVTFVPYIDVTEKYPNGESGINGYISWFNNWITEFTIISKTEAKIKFVNTLTGKTMHDGGTAKVEQLFGKYWIIHNGFKSPLWRKETVTILQKDNFGIL